MFLSQSPRRKSHVKLAVSNSGPLIHLAKAGLLEFIKLYDVLIPSEVKYEVVDRGKEKGFSDAVQIEKAIEDGWIRVIDVDMGNRFAKAAEIAGLHKAEVSVIYYAYMNGIIALLDEDAARVFARGLGVKVKGSLGLLVEGLKKGVITYSKAINGLNNLSRIMYLSSDVYSLVLRELERLRG